MRPVCCGCAGTGGNLARTILSSDCTHATCSTFSADGDHVACGFSDGSLRVWDANSALELSRLVACTAAVACVGFGAVNHIVVSLSRDGTLISWDCQQRLRLHTYHFGACSHRPTAFALLFCRRVLAIGTLCYVVRTVLTYVSARCCIRRLPNGVQPPFIGYGRGGKARTLRPAPCGLVRLRRPKGCVVRKLPTQCAVAASQAMRLVGSTSCRWTGPT
jgi:hypothetical protein